MTLRRLALACALLAAMPAAGLAAPAPGSKNFTPPSSAPDYFSNESGPFRGAVAEPPYRPPAAAAFAAPPARALARRPGRHYAARGRVARQHLRVARRGRVVHARAVRTARTKARPHFARAKSVAVMHHAPAKARHAGKARG